VIVIGAALDAARLAREFAASVSGMRYQFEVKDATQSTNDDVRALAAEGAPEGTIVLAEEQSAGRGRRGNVWIAPPRRCLLFSILLRPTQKPEYWPRVTHLAALAVCRTVDTLISPERAKIKWPNDVLINQRKISGILLESAASSNGGFLVLGMGINVNLQPADFPAELQTTASSLLQESGQVVDRIAVLARFLREFADLYASALEPFDSALAEVHQRSSLIGKTVTMSSSGQQVSGCVSGFGPGGELLLRLPNGAAQIVCSGELVRETSL
jgi:BirA family biotin operon repressor/biotin-[acetyl-CoA-carboxylase] ligase